MNQQEPMNRNIGKVALFIVSTVVNIAIFVYDRSLAKEKITMTQTAIES